MSDNISNTGKALIWTQSAANNSTIVKRNCLLFIYRNEQTNLIFLFLHSGYCNR